MYVLWKTSHSSQKTTTTWIKIVYDQPEYRILWRVAGNDKADYEWSGNRKNFYPGVPRQAGVPERWIFREMLNQLVQRGNKIKIQTISGHRIDVNNIDDFSLAGEF